ncbi:MAG: DUF2933 domain-containing protein, partial [Burkholderiales bacterium]|nr:DUF2933 domain-containing protein [Burkholderiales bacterium]
NSGDNVQSKTKWVLIAFLAIAAYFLILEHKAHLSGLLYYLPFLLLLACPLLHMFMHKGHGGHGGNGGQDSHHSGTRPDTQREGEKK